MSLRTPLVWNGSRTWTYDITLLTPRLFLLRDHITLFQDLIYDWSTGPPVELKLFVPMTYEMKLVMKDLQIFLCCNELNVIDQPNDLDDNGMTSPS